MADLTLTVQPRDIVGKKVRRLRRTGLLPAVVYGPTIAAPHSVQLDRREFEAVYHAAGTTQLVDLVFAGDGGRTTVFIRDVQYNLLKRQIDHVDFYAANLRVETTMAVPVVLAGEAPIAARGEAIVTLSHASVTVRALPTDIPAHLEADISRIETLGDDIRVADLPVPPNVTVIDSPDTVIVSVTRPTVEVEEEAPVEEAAAADTAEEAADEEAAAATEENA